MQKSILFVFELEAGMIIAEDVFSPTGQLLAPAHTRLDNTSIKKLRLYNITTVAVVDDNNEVRKIDGIEPTYCERVRQSADFQEFKAEYTQNLENFHDAINDIVKQNAPVDTDSLLKETSSLLEATSNSFYLFDMLHNMREFDDATFAHCLNVALIANMMGKWLKMPEEDIKVLTLCGLLHDIGKLTTPEHILMKPGKLTEGEYDIIKNHVKEGYQYLKKQDIDPRIKEACLFHHERCDGTGYPYGFTGKKIPAFAKIISIADVYDAMTAKRVYRGPICPFTVVKFLETEGYSKYDPHYLLPFLENVVATYINTTVRLNNGQIGDVVLLNKLSPSKPLLKCGHNFIDLYEHPELKIEAII